MKNFFDNLKYFPKKKQSIGYIGWLGHKNLGDEAMYIAFKELFKGCNILPYKFSKKIEKLENILKRNIYQSVCLGGGTLINTEDCWLELKEAQARYGKTFIFGSGVRNPIFWKNKFNQCYLDRWKDVIQKCDFVGVRGPLSEDILLTNGVKNAKIIGDPALFFTKNEYSPKHKKKKIGINIGVSNQQVWGKEDDVLCFAVKFVKNLLDENWDVTFLSVCPKDEIYIDEAIKMIGKPIPVLKNYLNIQKSLKFLESCDVFVGEKLHSVILAMCMHTPSVMLEYRPKCVDFMKSMEMEKFNVRTDNLSIDNILNLVEELYDKNDLYSKFIFEKASNYKNLLVDSADEIKAKIKQCKFR